MKKVFSFQAAILFCLFSFVAPNFLTAQTGNIPTVSQCWPVGVQISMNSAREALLKKIKEHDNKVNNYNSRCARDFKVGEEAAYSSCLAESKVLDAEETTVNKLKDSFLFVCSGYEKQYTSSDPKIVNGCNVPSGLGKKIDSAIAAEYDKAPEGVSDRVRKGFQAIQVHDWTVAKAWFQDALLRDKDNPGLKKLVDLSEYSISLKKPAALKKTAYDNLTSQEKNILNIWIHRVRDAATKDVYVDATAGLPASALDKVRKYVYGLSDAERDKLFFPDDFMTELLLYDMTK
ncbi:MAG: hypothetical protein HY252_08785 [Sphingobacteriales bacterium]|nr:hypothetical protein [Sphingobacteriales bacterium]